MYKYAVQYELVAKDYSQYTRITKEDNDTQGVPFTQTELQQLWEHKGQDINENVYTHKDLSQLREAVEAIKTGYEC